MSFLAADEIACTGDTTAYSISWLMKEIHHKDNRHLDALNKIRAEAQELGFTGGYLDYAQAPVCQQLGVRLHIELHSTDTFP